MDEPVSSQVMFTGDTRSESGVEGPSRTGVTINKYGWKIEVERALRRALLIKSRLAAIHNISKGLLDPPVSWQ